MVTREVTRRLTALDRSRIEVLFCDLASEKSSDIGEGDNGASPDEGRLVNTD